MESASSASLKGSAQVVHGSMNWEPVRKRLLGSDLSDALKAASELREGIEIVHTTEFPLMLSALLPAFSSILAQRTRPSPDVSSTENKLRRTVLEIISRMPSNEVLRPHAPHLVALSISILNTDYEENALLASRIIFDLYKVYRSLPQEYVQPYLDFVISSYRSLPMAIQRNFALLPPPAPAAATTTEAQSTTTSNVDDAKTNPQQNAAKSGTAKTEATPSDNNNPQVSSPAAASTTKTTEAKSTTPAAASTPSATPAAADPAGTAQATPTASLVKSPESAVTSSPMSRLSATPPRPRLALRANLSFRCLCEHPLLVMLKFQLYPNTLPRNIPILVQVMMQALDQRPPSMQSLVVPPNTTIDSDNRRHYFAKARELVAAQAKTLSFLTYLLRGFSRELKPYEERLAGNVVALMATCPKESISTRKELLVATRHLLNSDFRTGFFGHVDKLLDERVLIGCGSHRYSGQASLRPLAYTALSDLIHHVKTRLNMSQMSKVVCMFSRILHDSATLPLSTQYTAVRTLLSVIEIVFQNKDPNPQKGRDLLFNILSALVHKLETVKEYLELVKKNVDASSNKPKSDSSYEQIDLDWTTLGRSYAQLATDHRESCVGERSDARDRNSSYDGISDASNSWRDLRSMIRAIVVGHKTVIWYINNYRSQREKDKSTRSRAVSSAGTNEEVASALQKMTNSERALIDKYILLAIPCMQFLKDGWSCSADQKTQSLASRKQSSSSDQYRDVLSYFAAAFTTLDGYDLKRTLGRRLDVLVDAIIDDPAMMVIPRHLLSSNPTTSYEFCAILLRYLVDRMDELSLKTSRDICFIGPPRERNLREVETLNPQVEEALKRPTEDTGKVETKAGTYLQLFERVLKSLTLYSENEAAVRPHLRVIVATCLRSSMEESDHWPDSYCMLLRYVFRSISAGKFEESYKELLPLIPAALNGLYRVMNATKCRLIRNTCVELCLTIPARLSSLLPHMNLLLRIIVQALSSRSGDLVNLGLRTLEFWVDNLNPDYLYPEMSRQTSLFTQLMTALTYHLKPAPYPYGLLTLRLLGKLGGKNRRFLRESMDICTADNIEEVWRPALSVECAWPTASAVEEKVSSNQEQDEGKGSHFELPLPLNHCLAMLKRFAAMEGATKANKPPQDASSTESAEASGDGMSLADPTKLWDINVEDVDFDSYFSNFTEQTKQVQAKACLSVILTALANILEVSDEGGCSFKFLDDSDFDPMATDEDECDEAVSDHRPSSNDHIAQARNQELQCITLCVLYSCIVPDMGSEPDVHLKGFASHVFYVVLSYHRCFQRIDAHGTKMDDDFGSKNTAETHDETGDKSAEEERHGSLTPFGYFLTVGRLCGTVNPLTFNKALSEFLALDSLRSSEVGLEVVRHLLMLAKETKTDTSTTVGDSTKPSPDSVEPLFQRGTLVFFENLLSHLCEVCFSHSWHRHEGVHDAICMILEVLGSFWGLKYEQEIMMVAFFVLKNVPRELSTTSIKAFRFFVKLSCRLYGRPNGMNTENGLVWDALAVTSGKESAPPKESADTARVNQKMQNLSPSVLQMALSELASPKQIVRAAARFLLKHFIPAEPSDSKASIFTKHLSLIRRVIFSRSLRLLPLQEQVSSVEALAFIVNQASSTLPLTDSHQLAFLSELLKMSSVADGEMSDAALSYVVDKNGKASSGKKSTQGNQRQEKSPSHASAIFRRRECLLKVEGVTFVIPEELPDGVQLRVSSISLLRSVIKGQPQKFFESQSQTPIGNIRPHVVSLLFRSLVSNPVPAVVAAHEALHETLTLSATEGQGQKSRLPKELLQTCIRPVLLNLREHTKLSVPLLRGLSRLLSLLSSWFNKTLGEKLLDHLQKWTDPSSIKSQKIWTPGQEPCVAAAIIDLFSLLPHASQFVEPLVKTTIKLEAYLPGFNGHFVSSPYRRPLARYLNKHCQYTVGFFFQRLKAPIYSELFQHIVRLDECVALRSYLSGRQCSVMMLNLAMERPLAIIRSEKAPTTPSTALSAAASSPKPGSSTVELFQLHGIQTESAPPVHPESILKQDLEVKKKKLQALQQAFSRAKESAQKDPKQYNAAKAALDKGTRDLTEAKQRFAAEFGKPGSKNESGSASSTLRPMNTESLELQHQGFSLIGTLISNDSKYLQEHNDVVRALRWLWRSKGRYLRLLHEENVSPRYHEESSILVTFLMKYAQSFPNDVDVLFELIRIFLQPSTRDFSLVRFFLCDTVRNLQLAQKKQLVQRFFTLLAGESTEETKAFSIQLLLLPLLSPTDDVPGAKPTKDDPPEEKDKMQIDQVAADTQALVDAGMIQKFTKEVLFDKGRPTNCGAALAVELLRVTNSMLTIAPQQMKEYQKDVIRFCWTFIKSEDAICKAWGYIVVAHLISLFETKPSVILQVYTALLRLHQQEGKNLVRKALGLLVPALKKRLSKEDFKKSIECTSRITFEDGSVPQLAHIWHTIVENADVFAAERATFFRYMVNSLNRLGLPPNSLPENRALAVSIVDLLLQWDEWGEQSDSDQKGTGRGRKRKFATTLLDKSMIETIGNFLLRLKILCADPKVDAGVLNLDVRTMKTFRAVLKNWENCLIRPIYFEKVVNLCKEEMALEISNLKELEHGAGKAKSPRSVSMKATLSTAEGKKNDSKLVTTEMLLACLDIFTALMEEAPQNKFLVENGSLLKTILGSCFRHACLSEGYQLHSKLRNFTVGLYRSSLTHIEICTELVPFVNSLLEGLIARPDEFSCSSSVSEQSRPSGSRGKEKVPAEASDARDSESQPIQFALTIIEEICQIRKDCFAVFTGALLSLGSRLLRKHLASISAKKRQGAGHAHQAGTSAIPHMHPTPTEGILDSIEIEDPSPNIPGIVARPITSKQGFANSTSPLKGLVTVVRLFESSNVPFSLSENRRMLFHMLSSILDNSDDVRLLMAAVKVVGDAQPLAELIAHFVIKSLRMGRALAKSEADADDPYSEESMIRRALTACLLTPNRKLRGELLSLHAAQASGTESSRSVQDILWHLLHSDYEGISNRCWIVIFVEVLLKSCTTIGRKGESSEPWLPTPKWDTSSGAGKELAREALSSFYDVVAKLQTTSNAVIPSLQVLAHGNTTLCSDLFGILLPAAWDALPSDGMRLAFAPALEKLLAKPFHSQCMRLSRGSPNEQAPSNVVQLLLAAVANLRPRPMLDAHLLVYLASNYNCWYQVLELLEQQYTILKANNADMGSGKPAPETLSAMFQCCRNLGDWELWMSLADASCKLQASKRAISLEQKGAFAASEAYSKLVHGYQADEPQAQNPSDFELSMWEERWIELQQELCQRGVVATYAKLSENPRLQLESAWKAQQWDKVREQVASPALITAMEAGDPMVKICDALLSVANGKHSEVENSHAQAAQLCLYRWQQLPKISRASSSHSALLHQFHRLVEIRESGQMMVETSNHSSGRTLPDLKNLLNAWRHRLPNDCDKLTMWDDVFTWRSHMFNAVTRNFHWSEPNTLATLHDKPWTAIRIAKTGRKQGERTVALQFLNKLTGNRSMDVNDAFHKLREQILIYDSAESDLERTGGLNLINTTNLSFFDAKQKSELFRLKAVFLASLGLRSKSNQAFCHSVQVCPSHARAWVSWGGLCSHLGALTEKQMEQTAAKSGSEPSKETRANTAKKVAQYLAQSMGCYFEAIQLTTEDWARIHLPKCLLMLVKDGASPGVLCQTLENRGGELPPWVWLAWTPYLLSCLCRNERRAAKAILVQLVKLYPQAVYYALRSFYLERRDVERSKGAPPTPGGHMGSVSYAEDMMSTLRRSHASLWSSLESILEELIVKFRPSYEEELLSTITALIERADSQDATKGDDADTMLASVAKTVGRIAVKFFRPTSDGGSSRNDERARKTAEFKVRYKSKFETDFKVSSEKEQPEKGPQLSLEEYLTILKGWRRRLEGQVALTPVELPLLESSRSLSLFAADAPDLWAGACDTTTSSAKYNGRPRSQFETEGRSNQSTTSSSEAAARKAATNAANAVIAAAAQEGVGGHYGGGSSIVEIPGMYPPNCTSTSDLKPCPELHAKLVSFGPTISVLRREHLVRRVSLLGSDGSTYHFLLQFAIPYWTRTDERVAQTHFVLDKFLRKNWRSLRRDLSLEPTAVIPVAQRLRMTADSSSRISLDEIYKRKCLADGEDPNAVVNFFNTELAKAQSRKQEEQENQQTVSADALRVEVLKKACERTEDQIMLQYMSASLGNPEAVFNFRRSFADQFAANSLLQYVFAVVERNPSRVVFSQTNGRVQSPDFRVSYNNQGFIESRTIPFRMTPNLRTSLGLPFLSGRFVTSMATVAEAARSSKDELDPIWRLLMRDDIVAWYCKSMAKSDSKLQELEKQLADRVSKNVYYMQMRFAECSLRESGSKSSTKAANTAKDPIDQKVRDLIEIASRPDKLATMPTSYQAWL
ncbi:PI3/PI4-kinase family protein C1F5.11c [Seminavis robusta]|uniref:PI3/PI4-kinase family protein C1F5.11c n=1 Tax=Seminavis robusta TaxID=568900 RepID=A0A9N8EA77_9STRA|nr:PI3/PI4-kinase family protein C1F5.11c [Seminavis robusta]|eukprot:Sro872_g213950.1 PI3/PI4-kinase family protein C1F5.11c (4409) ;mRNA; r:21908-36453